MENKELKIILSEYSDGKESGRKEKELGIEFPLYAQCYREALSAILNNVAYNQSVSKDRKEKQTIYIGGDGNGAVPLDSSNIIAFIGERGSGKTTAVNEFCQILYYYHVKRKEWESEIVYKNKENLKCRFHLLAPIDASVLETKEDLLEVILANMYQAFSQKLTLEKGKSQKNNLLQMIARQFDEVYKGYINVRSHDDQRLLGESVLVKLRNTSSTLKTKAAIEELISYFLNLLDEDDDGRSYLVVTIDDLDMSPENGFEMLEQLHKYLENQRVIILIAIKYSQMKMLCDKHFVNCLIPKCGSVHKSVFDKFEERAKKLSSDYLLKVLPLSNRIYMPERPLLDDRSKVLAPDRQFEGAENGWTVKEFILRKIAVKMNIFYDAKGVKKHFCLPDTIRELVAYNDFLESLFSMEEIGNAQADKHVFLYDQNHERFNSDIEERMAVKILSDEQLKLYQLIMKRNIERRARYAVNFLAEWSKNEGKDKDGKLRMEDRVDERKGQNYCYADLLKAIYQLGRVDYTDKVLVHCLLASFTSEMVREYYSYINNKDSKAKERAANRLLCFRGRTFGGDWFNEVMPTAVRRERKEISINVGFVSDAQIENGEIELSYPVDGNWIDVESKLLGVVTDIIPYMECMMLLFSNFRDESGMLIHPKWRFEFSMGESEEGEVVQVRINNYASLMDFDIFGFIGKEINNKKSEDAQASNKEGKNDSVSFEALHSNLASDIIEGIKSYCQINGQKLEKNDEELKEELRRHSIWFGDEEVKKNLDNAVFPYYNLDMSYNILKRVRIEIRENVAMREKEVYDYFRTVYGYIAQELCKEEDFYKQLINEEEVPGFFEDFVNSPFIKAFGIRCAGENADKSREGTLNESKVNDIFSQVLKGLKINDDLVMKDLLKKNFVEPHA